MKKALATFFIAIGSLFFVNSAFAAPALVNSCESSVTGSATSTHCSLGTVTSGDIIIAAIETTAAGTVPTLTDKGGNTYTSSSQQIWNGSGREYIFYSANVTGGSTFNVTSTYSTSTTFSSIGIFEYSGIATSSPLDAATSTSFSGHNGAFNSGTSTSNFAGDLLVGTANCNGAAGVTTPGAGFSYIASSTNQCGITEATTTGATGSYSALFTTSQSLNLAASMALFKARVSASTPTPQMAFRWINDE
jgi:hypothetical protein